MYHLVKMGYDGFKYGIFCNFLECEYVKNKNKNKSKNKNKKPTRCYNKTDIAFVSMENTSLMRIRKGRGLFWIRSELVWRIPWIKIAIKK